MYQIVNSQLLMDFWTWYPESQEPLKAWYHLVKEQSWQTPEEVLQTFPTAELGKNNQIRFPVVPHPYYVLTSLHLGFQVLVIRGVGSLPQLEETLSEHQRG